MYLFVFATVTQSLMYLFVFAAIVFNYERACSGGTSSERAHVVFFVRIMRRVRPPSRPPLVVVVVSKT